MSQENLPHNVAVFKDHLAHGLKCFGLDWSDFRPIICNHKDYGNGILFSQFKGVSEGFAAEFALIVSDTGLHTPREDKVGFLPFNNKQSPTKMAFLVLSAIVRHKPLDF
jgi:hypothetical protein